MKIYRTGCLCLCVVFSNTVSLFVWTRWNCTEIIKQTPGIETSVNIHLPGSGRNKPWLNPDKVCAEWCPLIIITCVQSDRIYNLLWETSRRAQCIIWDKGVQTQYKNWDQVFFYDPLMFLAFVPISNLCEQYIGIFWTRLLRKYLCS